MKAGDFAVDDNLTEITKLAKAGDRHAFSVLYEQYYIELYRYALYMLKNPDEAKDAVSAAVLTAYENIGSLKDASRFKAWMLKILYRVIIKQLKISNKTESFKAPPESGDILECDMNIDLKRALMSLKEDERSVVLLTVLHDYNSAEISRILHINSKTIRSKRARALKKLRDVLNVQ